MAIYSITCFVSVLLAWIMEHIKYEKETLNSFTKAVLVSVPAIIITGFRYGIGSDYFSYQNIFYFSDNFKEPLFLAFNEIIQFMGGGFYTSVFIISIIFFVLVFWQIFRDSKYPWLSVFLLFGMIYFFAFMNAMRQFLAISILVYSLRFLEKEKDILFFFFLGIAVGIHHASILFIFAYLMVKIKADFKVIILITPLVYILSYIGKDFIIGPLISLLDYSRYLGTSIIGYRVIGNFLWQIILVVLSCLVYNKAASEEEQKKYKLYFNIQILSLWVYSFWGGINPNEIQSLLTYFQFPSIIFAPIVLQRIKSRGIKNCIIILILVYFIINIFITIAINNENETLPYRMIFDIMY